MELSAALRQAANLLEARASLPPESWLSRLVRLRPLTALIVLALVPHLLGSFVNIAYNTSQIALSPEQDAVFDKLIPFYNAIVYPLCVLLVGWAMSALVQIINAATTNRVLIVLLYSSATSMFAHRVSPPYCGCTF